MNHGNNNNALSLGLRTGNARLALLVCGVLLGLGFTARVEAVSISSSYDMAGKKLTVSITGQSENWDDLEIRCGKNDVVGTFATATANWSVDSIITRNGKKFCKLVRSSPISSDEDVEITHTDTKNRGKGGSISITLAGTVLTTKTGQASLLMVGACTLPNSDDCLADVPQEECEAIGGTFLGDDTTTCPSGEFVPPACGDNVVNQLSEECDGIDDASCPSGCLSNCICAVCGNDILEEGEWCDGTDDVECPGGCLADCTCDPDAIIPAVSDWGLVAMTLLVLTAATVLLLRRRAGLEEGNLSA